MSQTPITSKPSTSTGKKTSALTLVVKYESPVYKAGGHKSEFTFRGDMQQAHFKTATQLIALTLTLYYERAKNKVVDYAIYDNRPEASPYPANIIVQKLNDVLMHDNTALYPPQVFEQLNKYKLI